MKRGQVFLLEVLIIGELAAFYAQQRYPGFMDRFCVEDGWVENTQAVLLAIASLLFVIGARRRGWRNVWYWGYAALFFFNCGEEISWGQRIFGIATPAKLERVNVQQELNLHNLVGVDRHARMLGMLVVVGMLFVIPWAAELSTRARALLRRWAMPVAEPWVGIVAALAASVMLIPRLQHQIVFNLDEIGELYLYLSFFCFSLQGLAQASTLPAPARVEAPQLSSPPSP